jgi:hypothetical protein
MDEKTQAEAGAKHVAELEKRAEASRRDDVEQAIRRMKADRKQHGSSEHPRLSTREEDIRTLLEHPDTAAKFDASLTRNLERAVDEARQRGGSHAALNVTDMDAALKGIETVDWLKKAA